MTAMLGMYDMPALQAANDRFWSLIRSHIGFGPMQLDRARDVWDIWLDPDLVLAQTCGMPYRTRLHGQVQLVGAPDYGLPECRPGHYASVFVARQDDPRPLSALALGTFAYNEALSQSGWAAAITHLSGLGVTPTHLRQTGAHALSAQMVSDGDADFAALDALTWSLLKEHTDLGSRLRDVSTTTPSPALPFITSSKQDPDQIARAMRKAIAELSDQDRQLLHIRGLIDIPPDQYLAVPTPPTPAALAHGS